MVRFQIQKCKLKTQMCNKDFSSALAKKKKTKLSTQNYITNIKGTATIRDYIFYMEQVTNFYQHTFN